MSGHSKWSTIKRQKGATDAKRGAAFTKLGNAIAIATREGGGGDPDSNFKLRLAIEKARAANMPKENIQRSIDRGLGKGAGGDLAESIFEGFAPGGVAVMVETISDNNTRTVNDLRNVFNKLEGNLGSTGSVSYLFTRVGEIELEPDSTLFDKAVDAGAIDVEDNFVYTKPEDVHKVKEELEKVGLKVLDSGLIFRPNKETMVTVSDPSQTEKIHSLLTAVDDLDDVQNVYANLA